MNEALTPTAQQMLWVHNRGVNVLLAPDTTSSLTSATQNGATTPPDVSEELRIITEDGILKKRYPTPEAGASFMQSVDPARQRELLCVAGGLVTEIQGAWKKINPSKQVDIVVFGSVARGLTKEPGHPDPSNIDLTVVGEIDDKEREALLSRIRDTRLVAQKKILEDCPNVNSEELNPGNAGVLVQNAKKLTNGHYEEAKMLIGSSAWPLASNGEYWRSIKVETINRHRSIREEKQTKRRLKHLGDIFSKPIRDNIVYTFDGKDVGK